jgi:hypothetical protein
VELAEAGAETEMLARATHIAFHSAPREPRSLAKRIKNPRSTIGLGWRSKLAVDLPLVFHRLPERLRHRVVARHLGPAPGWFVRERFEGRVTTHLGCRLDGVTATGTGVLVRFRDEEGAQQETPVDHVIAATGFRPLLSRLGFLDAGMAAKIRTEDGTPEIDRNFRTSVPGLYMTGLATANNFGPLCRFACGAEFTVKRLAPLLARSR